MKTMKLSNPLKQLLGVTLLLLFCSQAWAINYNIQHVMQSLKYVSIITQDFCILAGIGFLLTGLFKMKKYGEARTFMSHQLTLMKPLSMLIVGACLLSIPVAAATIMRAFWGDANPLPYPIAGGGMQEYITPVIVLIRLVGLFGLIRGIMMFSKTSGEQAQPGMMGKAVLHLIGGVLCLHIINTYHIVVYMLGFV